MRFLIASLFVEVPIFYQAEFGLLKFLQPFLYPLNLRQGDTRVHYLIINQNRRRHHDALADLGKIGYFDDIRPDIELGKRFFYPFLKLPAIRAASAQNFNFHDTLLLALTLYLPLPKGEGEHRVSSIVPLRSDRRGQGMRIKKLN